MAQFGVCYMPTDKHKIRTVKHSPHRCHFTGKKTKVGKYVGPMVTDNAAIHMELQNPKPDVWPLELKMPHSLLWTLDVTIPGERSNQFWFLKPFCYWVRTLYGTDRWSDKQINGQNPYCSLLGWPHNNPTWQTTNRFLDGTARNDEFHRSASALEASGTRTHTHTFAT